MPFLVHESKRRATALGLRRCSRACCARDVCLGDPGDKLYIIVRGSVEVLKRGPGGEERRLAVLQDGDVFGEIALLEDMPRIATIMTRTPCLMLPLGRQQFEHILATVPDLRIAFEQVAAARRRDDARSGRLELA